jgi:phage-related protein
MAAKKSYVALPQVREFIESQPAECRMEYQAIVDRLEADGFLVEPYGKKLEADLFEIRVRAGRQLRVLYFYYEADTVFGIHAFAKKTQRTPPHELKQARRVIGRIRRGDYAE